MKNIRDREVKWQELLPLALIIGIVPLLFRVQTYQRTLDEAVYYPGTGFNDLYSLIKAKALIFFTLLALGIFLYQLAKKRIHLEKSLYTVFAGVYGLAILFSSLLSPYDIAFNGLTDRFEGGWVLLSYVAIFFLCIHYGRQRKAIDVFTHTLMASSILMGFFGFLQYVGYDPYTEGFLRYFAFPREVWSTVGESVKTSFETGVVGSLYNPNFMGSYAAMMTLLSLGYVLKVNSSKKQEIFYIIANLVSFSALVGSRSSAGLIGFSAGMIIMVLFMPKALKKSGKRLVPLILAWLAMVIVMILIYAKMWNGNRLIQQDYLTLFVYFLYFVGASILYRYIFNRREKNKALLAISFAFAGLVLIGAALLYSPLQSVTHQLYYGESQAERKAEDMKGREKLQNVVITPQQIQITEADGDYIAFEIKDNTVKALDAEGNNLGFNNSEAGHYQVKDQAYQDYELVLTKIHGAEDQMFALVPKFDIWVVVDEMGLAYKGRNHKPDQIDSPARFGFQGRESIFTYRGYIWSRTIPLLKKHVLLGAGPDCFVFEFPQYEHITKWNINQPTYLLYDKPHNWYLQMGINTGLLSLLAVLAMGFLLLFQSIKKYMLGGQEDPVTATLLAMVFAYAAASIFNDSVISVAPIFWMIFGLAVGAVNGLKQAKKTSKKGKKS
ncbi:O-antigen ligase family protein [Gottschalkiaceae bacterium SANA]|nr:O-antigen ligase family protein [Gottschalkiaceae bacterium SANA]